MDQRANSIADLAIVLREQEALGEMTEKARIEKKEAEETAIREELVRLAEEERNGGLPVLEQAIQAQEAVIADMRAKKAAGEPGAPVRRDIHRQHQALKTLKLKQQKMIAAKEVFEQGHAKLVRQAESKTQSGELQPGASTLELDIDPPLIFYHPTPEKSTRTIPKRGALKSQVAEKKTPLYTTRGVVIRWANPLDAEYADSWPVTVEHQDAGYSRHTAPSPDAEAILDIEGMNRSPKALEEMRIEAEGGHSELGEGQSSFGDFVQIGDK